MQENVDADLGLSGRLIRLAQHRRLHGAAARVLAVLAVVGVILGVWLAIAKLPEIEHPVHPGLLVGAVGLAGLSLVNNAIEYWWISRRIEIDVSPLQAARVSITATAMNALPLPGAAMVKFEDLYRRGARARRAVALITSVTVMVVGIAFALTGVLALVDDASTDLGWTISLLILGTVTIAVAGALVRSATTHWWSAVWIAALIETGSVVLAGVRMLLIVNGLGYRASVTQAFALSLAGIVAVVVGIAPSGLGVREGLAALFGRISGQAASVSVVASAVDRLVTYTALVLLGGVLVGARSVTRRRQRPGSATERTDTPVHTPETAETAETAET